MSGKVLHIDDDTHKLVREYCAKMGVSTKVWVSEAVKLAMAGGFVDMKSRPPGAAQEVKRRDVQTLIDKSKDSDYMSPWEQPPFWKQTK